MDILLGPPQNIFTTDDEPLFQEWAPLPNPYPEQMYYHPNAGFVPDPDETVFKIKDVIGAPGTEQYSAFRLVAYQNYLSGNPVAWLNPTCYTGIGYPNAQNAPLTITENGLEFEFTPVFQNLNLLPVGQYNFYHHFKVQGQLGLNWLDISSYEHRTRLIVTNTPIYISPATHHFVHNQGGTLPHKDFSLYGDDWKIVGNPRIVLSSSTSGTTVTNITDETGTYQSIEGIDGSAIFRVTLTDYYDGLGEFEPSALTGQLKVIQGSSTIVGYVNYTVTVNQTPGLTATPPVLNFSAVIGLSEPDAQNITFMCTEAYTIEASPWLTFYEQTSVVDGLIQQQIVVRPIATANFTVGTFSGYVKIKSTISGVDQERVTVVNFDVQDFVTIDYQKGLAAFTLDEKYIRFSTFNIDTYFEVTLNATVYDFHTGLPTTTTLTYKISLYKKSQTFNVGRIIDRLMKRFTKPNQFSQFEYYPAEVTLGIQEKKIADNTVLRELFSNTLLFVAGYSPLEFANGACILNRTLHATRITPSTKSFINMYLPEGSYALLLKKNNATESIIESLTIDRSQIYSYELDFAGHNIDQGSVVKFSLTKVGDALNKKEVASKIFKCFPKGQFSSTIIWEDFYRVRHSFEFTGGYRYGNEMDHVTHDYYRNLNDFLEKLRTNKKLKFSINTGWILKDDIQKIEDLLENRRAWLVLPGGKLLSMVPVTKDIVKENTDADLIEYDVEFQINQGDA